MLSLFIGGMLFDCGGFPLPFIVSGGLLVFCGLAAAIVLDPSEELRQAREEGEEKDEELESDASDDGERKGSFFRSTPVILGLLITILTGMANQWYVNILVLLFAQRQIRYQPSLEPYVRKEFSMTSFQVSLKKNTAIQIVKTFPAGQHALHYRWGSLCSCQSPHWISP